MQKNRTRISLLLRVFFIVLLTTKCVVAKNLGVSSLAVAPDGRTVASAGKNLAIWDLKGDSIKLKRTLPLNIRETDTPLAFAPDNKTLAVNAGKIQFWDFRRARLLRTLRGYGESPRRLAFSADGSQLAGAVSKGRVMLWNTKTGHLFKMLQARRGNRANDFPDYSDVRDLIFSADGTILTGVLANGSVLFWNTKSGKKLRRIQVAAQPSWIANSGDCQTLATTTGNPIRIWDVNSGKQRLSFPRPGGLDVVERAMLSSNGRKLATLTHGDSSTLKLWNAQSGKLLKSWKTQGAQYLMEMCFTPDGKRIITGDSSGVLRLWPT